MAEGRWVMADNEHKVGTQPLDLVGLTSTQKGRIVESRVQELLLLHGGGLLSVYTPASDIEAIDLIVLKKGEFRPLYVQVKGRFGLSGRGRNLYIQDIRAKSFRPHPLFYIVFAYFDPGRLELYENLFLVPSEHMERVGSIVGGGRRGDRRYRIATSLNPTTRSKWYPYVCHKRELAPKLLTTIDQVYTLFR